MNAQITEKKKALRALMKQRRCLLSPDYRQSASITAAQFAADLLPQNALRIALYGALPDELDPLPLARSLIARGCTLLYPKVTKGQATWASPYQRIYRRAESAIAFS